MNKSLYTIFSEGNRTISFTSEEDAECYCKAFPEKGYVIHESEMVMHLNALSFINWLDIKKTSNFIYRDSTGVYESYFKPSKSKWFNNDYSIYKLYGGESFLLPEKNYHHLIKLGDIFERPYGRTNHFIDWKRIKGSHFIKFQDDANQSLTVFDKEGSLIYSGSNKEAKVIDTNKTMRFNSFLYQTYTFEKTDKD